MNLAYQVAEVLVPAIGQNQSFCEGRCYAVVRVEYVPVLVDNPLNGGRFLLYAVVKGVREFVDFGLSVSRASRGTSSVFLSWMEVSLLG